MRPIPRRKRKVGLEPFYTSRPLAQRCVALVEARFPLGTFPLVLEPAAGDGAFLDLLPHATRLGLDLHPATTGILQADFLHWTPPPPHDDANANVLTVGNPPFGQRGGLAIAFLNRACQFSRVVAFILPRSFRKDTFLNRIDRRFHLVHQEDCDAFRRPDNAPVRIKAVFQVWERRDQPRPLIERATHHDDFLLRHAHLSRVSPDELARLRSEFDFAIPQVGSVFRPRPAEAVTVGSHWFVKARRPWVRETFGRLDFSFLRGMNLSFTSLSKRDIIQAYQAARPPPDPARPWGRPSGRARPWGRARPRAQPNASPDQLQAPHLPGWPHSRAPPNALPRSRLPPPHHRDVRTTKYTKYTKARPHSHPCPSV